MFACIPMSRARAANRHARSIDPPHEKVARGVVCDLRGDRALVPETMSGATADLVSALGVVTGLVPVTSLRDALPNQARWPGRSPAMTIERSIQPKAAKAHALENQLYDLG